MRWGALPCEIALPTILDRLSNDCSVRDALENAWLAYQERSDTEFEYPEQRKGKVRFSPGRGEEGTGSTNKYARSRICSLEPIGLPATLLTDDTIKGRMHFIAEELATLEKPAAVMTVALPGSGKTTLLDRIMPRLRPTGLVKVVSPDDIRDELSGTQKRQATYDRAMNGRVWEITYARTQATLELGGLAIIDATHLSRYRDETVQELRARGAKMVAALVLEIPLELAQARNKARGAAGRGYVRPQDIDRMHAFMQENPLTPEEPGPFDVVVIYPHIESGAQ